MENEEFAFEMEESPRRSSRRSSRRI